MTLLARMCKPSYVATVLDCSVDAVYDEINRGNLAALRIGSDLRIEITELDRYIERKKAEHQQRIALRNAPRRGRRPASAAAAAS